MRDSVTTAPGGVLHVRAEVRHTTIMAEFNEMPGMRLATRGGPGVWCAARARKCDER